MLLIQAGALEIVPLFENVTLEIITDDWPSRYPFLEEPRTETVTAQLAGDLAYGLLAWTGIPTNDARVLVEVDAGGNKAARFRWSDDGGTTWEEANSVIEVPLGGSVALGSSGLTANFAASPAPQAGTSYTFTEAGTASKTGTGPTVTISGSGSVSSGRIEIQTGVGSLKYSLDAGATWSASVSMGNLPMAISSLGIELDIPPDDHAALFIATGAQFSFRVRGYFTVRLSRGAVVETYERMRVSDPLFFASPGVPVERRSKLVSSAIWAGEQRPPVGTYHQ